MFRRNCDRRRGIHGLQDLSCALEGVFPSGSHVQRISECGCGFRTVFATVLIASSRATGDSISIAGERVGFPILVLVFMFGICVLEFVRCHVRKTENETLVEIPSDSVVSRIRTLVHPKTGAIKGAQKEGMKYSTNIVAVRKRWS